jgi:2-phospho-L-lactate guanylyltransferase
MRSLLERTLALASAGSLFGGMLVVSRDPAVWEIARRFGAYALPEEGEDLNRALAQGRQYAADAGVRDLLILPADLPWLCAADLQELCRLGEQGNQIVVSPSQDGGTSALYLRLPSELPFCFGANSFVRHLSAARAAGYAPAVYDSPTLRFDLDTPSDLEKLASVV